VGYERVFLRSSTTLQLKQMQDKITEGKDKQDNEERRNKTNRQYMKCMGVTSNNSGNGANKCKVFMPYAIELSDRIYCRVEDCYISLGLGCVVHHDRENKGHAMQTIQNVQTSRQQRKATPPNRPKHPDAQARSFGASHVHPRLGRIIGGHCYCSRRRRKQ
jgi:hypothetical protein